MWIFRSLTTTRWLLCCTAQSGGTTIRRLPQWALEMIHPQHCNTTIGSNATPFVLPCDGPSKILVPTENTPFDTPVSSEPSSKLSRISWWSHLLPNASWSDSHSLAVVIPETFQCSDIHCCLRQTVFIVHCLHSLVNVYWSTYFV